jgi:hypothetical protein
VITPLFQSGDAPSRGPRRIQRSTEQTALIFIRQYVIYTQSEVAKLEAVISEIENGPRREIDMADSHTGDPAFMAKSTLLRDRGEREDGVYVRVYIVL